MPVFSAVQRGKCGELIAEAVFEENLYKSCRVNQEGFDLIIFDEDEPFRVEVKTSSVVDGRSYCFMTSKGSGSKQPYTTDNVDLMCFVALDLRRIVVKCVSSVTQKRTRLRPSEFEKCEATQIRKAIAEVRKRKC